MVTQFFRGYAVIPILPSFHMNQSNSQKMVENFHPMPKQKKSKRPSMIRKKINQKRWETIREEVVESARDGERYRCHHCGKLFPKEEVCADHYPCSRGSRPDLKYDRNNLVCSCKECNRSDNQNRREVTL